MRKEMSYPIVTAIAFTGAFSLVPRSGLAAEFTDTSVIVEINATDGDVGFHTLLDADAWRDVRIDDPDGRRIFDVAAKGGLLQQGITENFFESDEPLCSPDPDDPDAEVVPLSEFLERFPSGVYRFTGKSLENEAMEGSAELTYNLPAAPANITFDGAIVTWTPGSDLGGCQDPALITAGLIPDPISVPVVAWEISVEPADEDVADPLRTFTVQLPGQAPSSVTLPPEFVQSYLASDVSEFKVEVGAIEASGNRTFSEAEFDIEAP